MSGVFIHHPDGYIVMDGQRFSLELFRMVEPDYRLPPKAISRYYERGLRHTLSDGKNEWRGQCPWTQGDIYLSRLSDFVIAKIEDQNDDEVVQKAVEAAKFEELPVEEKRKRKYPSPNEMFEALWKHVVLGQSLEESGCSDLQSKREEIDDLYPLD